MRLKVLLILGPLLAIAGLGMNATMGQNEKDDPPAKKDDRRRPPKDDRKEDRKGGPKDDDGPPPHDERHGPDLRRIIDDLDLTRSQQEKVRKVMDDHQEKIRVLMEKSHRDLLAALKKALPAEEYRKLEKEIERRPKGPPKKDRKGPPREDGEEGDRKGPPKKDRKGPDEDAERIPAPRTERDGEENREP